MLHVHLGGGNRAQPLADACVMSTLAISGTAELKAVPPGLEELATAVTELCELVAVVQPEAWTVSIVAAKLRQLLGHRDQAAANYQVCLSVWTPRVRSVRGHVALL